MALLFENGCLFTADGVVETAYQLLDCVGRSHAGNGGWVAVVVTGRWSGRGAAVGPLSP